MPQAKEIPWPKRLMRAFSVACVSTNYLLIAGHSYVDCEQSGMIGAIVLGLTSMAFVSDALLALGKSRNFLPTAYSIAAIPLHGLFAH